MKERNNPQNPGDPKKWFASPVHSGVITAKGIEAELVALSSLTAGDVSNVIKNLLDIIPKYLIQGKSVQLADFGSFRITFSSEGVDSPKDFSTRTHAIKGIRAAYIPSTDLRNRLKQAGFEKVS